MKRLFITSTYLFLFIFGIAQKQESKHERELNSKIQKIANREFENLNYAYAIPPFKAYLQRVPKDTNSAIKLGYCYGINHQYDSALKYYLTANDNGAHVKDKIAELYAYLGDYSKAEQFCVVKDERSKGFTYLKPLLIDSADYTIKNTILNSPYDEFSAVYYKKGLVFESNRAKKINPRNEFAWNGSSFSNLYYINQLDNIITDAIVRPIWWEKEIKTSIDDLTYETSNDNNTIAPRYDFKKDKYKTKRIQKFDPQFSSKFNTGAVTFNKAQDLAFFTRNQQDNKGIQQLEIWEVEKKDSNTWAEPHRLAINNASFSNFHPSVTADGKRLYFASDRPGGFGKIDLYYIDKNADNSWSDAVNMGNLLNTNQDEMYPTIIGNVLYYSSNGHKGLGGLDINQFDLKTKINENLGYPVNSNGDDFSFITENGKTGFLSSNRYGSDDILHFDYEKKYLKIKGETMVNDSLKSIPLKLYQLDSLNNTKTLIDSIGSTPNGYYDFKIRPNRTYSLELSIKDSLPKIIDVKQDDIVYNIIIFEYDTVAKVLKPSLYQYITYFDLDKYNLTKAETDVLDSLIQVMKADASLVANISSYTDCAETIKYNLALSKKRSKAVINYLTKHNIPNTSILKKDYGEQSLVKACLIKNYNELEQIVNRRVTIVLSKDPLNQDELNKLEPSQFKVVMSSLKTRVPVKKKTSKKKRAIWGKEDK